MILRTAAQQDRDRVNFAIALAQELHLYLEAEGENLDDNLHDSCCFWINRVCGQPWVNQEDIDQLIELLGFDLAKSLKDKAVPKAQLQTDLQFSGSNQ